MNLSENEKKLIETVRAMKPLSRLVVEKKEVKNPTEFRLELCTVEYLPKDLTRREGGLE
jgi:hypothetical protein